MKKNLIVLTLTLCLVLAGSAWAGLDDGLMGYWPMDEGSGTNVSDQSGNGNDGTFRGSPGPGWVSGKVGGALDFAAPKNDDDMVVVPDDPSFDAFTDNNAWSVSFWSDIDGADSAWSQVLTKECYGVAYQNPFMFVQISGWADKGIGLGSNGRYYSNDGVHDGTWHHWTATYQGNMYDPPGYPTCSFYRDGDLIGRALWVGGQNGNWAETVYYMNNLKTEWLVATDAPVTIGGAYSNSGTPEDPDDDMYNSSIVGSLDEVGFWSRALSADEIAKLYTLGDTGLRVLSVERAHNPTPKDFAVDVPTDQVLSWDIAIEDPCTPDTVGTIVQHLVYMSNGKPTDPNLTQVATIDVADPAEYNPGGLNRDGQYFWRVDEKRDDDSIIPGEVWRFKTVLANPVFNPALPADVLVAQGDDAVLTVEVTNPWTADSTGMTYQWYMTPDVALSDGADYSGTATDTLTVMDVEPGDAGEYFCRVTITSSGNVGDSRAAMLAPKMLIGHWKLDGNANDELGINNGTEVNDPNWRPGGGIDGGGSLWLEGATAGDHILMENSSDYFNRMVHDDISVCIWAKTDGVSWAGLISKGQKNLGWMLQAYSGGMDWEVTNNHWLVGFAGIADGTWHQYVGTYDGTNDINRLFIDGKLVATRGQGGSIIDTANLNVAIGCRIHPGGTDSYFAGELDDARVYNYALSPVQVATLYQAVSGSTEPICAETPTYDYNGDCIADLEDLSMVLAKWLECFSVPDCVTDMPK